MGLCLTAWSYSISIGKSVSLFTLKVISIMKDHVPQHDLEVCPDSQGDAKGLGQAFDLDEAILRAQGREAELTRSFSWVGALGLAFRSALPACIHDDTLELMHCQVSSIPG